MTSEIGWIPVALSADIPAGTSAPGQVAGEDVAIWRSASGRLSVWPDRCPHRGMRLSHGFVRGEALSCIYHGWRYDAAGQCIRIPAHPELTPPAAIRVIPLATAEVSGVVWAAPAGAEPGAPPPAFPGFEGFRSLAVAAPPGAFGGTSVRMELGGCRVVALVQSLRGGGSGLHLLAPEDADLATLDTLSAAAEDLRRRMEASTWSCAA